MNFGWIEESIGRNTNHSRRVQISKGVHVNPDNLKVSVTSGKQRLLRPPNNSVQCLADVGC